MTHQFEEGDLVRLKSSRIEGILAEINPNENYVADDETWAELNDPVEAFMFRADVDSPDDLELVTKAKDIPVKRLPTLQELRNFISGAVHSGWDEGISVIESGPNGNDGVEVYGQLDNQRFTAYIKIESITWAD